MTTPAYEKLADKRLSSDLWPEPVKVIRVSPLGKQYEIWAEGIDSQKSLKRFVDSDTLEKLLGQLSPTEDFAADPELFSLGVEARRIQLGYSYDPFFAVSTSRVDPLPHQLEAVYGTLLKKPRVRFLIADDPGAGKTIMAGLLLKELKYRGMLDRILIVTPANLTDQWRRELKDKFGESFEVINSDTVRALYDENPWAVKPHAITSIDFAKQETYRNQLERANWDLVIIDEAHKLSARRDADGVSKSLRYRLGEVLSRTSNQLLFLTATPHQGDDEKFRLLLDLLEPDLFATRDLLEEAAAKDENPVMIRRLKEDMVDFEGQRIFPPRRVYTPSFRLSASERKLYDNVTEYVSKHFKRAWSDKKRNVGLAMTVLQRRLASSTYAIATSLDRRYRRLQQLKEEVLNIDISPLYNLTDEELADMPEEERWKIENEIAERLTLAQNIPDLEVEIRELKKLSDEARLLARLDQDRKLEQLLGILNKLDGLSAGEKLLVFTEHKDTLDNLMRVLDKKGYSVTSIHGGMRLEDRVAAEREFRDDMQVMVATEAAGEGINLQFCSVMVNYDLPWNPTRLEQRMGRIHRYGQKNEVHIYNLVAEGTREGDVLGLLLRKLDLMREQLGSDRVYDVVGKLLFGINLETLIVDYITGRKSLAEINDKISPSFDPTRNEKIIADVDRGALADREIDLKRLRDQKRDSELNRLQPEYVDRFFTRAFARLGGTTETRRDGLLRMRVPYELRRHHTSITLEYSRVTFDPHADPHSDGELIVPGHPLFEAVLGKTLELATPALQQGSSHALPSANAPGFLGYLELAVVDGTGATVSRRLYACLQDPELHTLPSSVLVDAVPYGGPNTPPDAAEVDAAKSALRNWAHDHLLTPFVEEVHASREREVSIRRKYGERSLHYLISESTKKLTTYKLKARQGEDMQLAILQEDRRLQVLRERQEAFQKRLAKESSLSLEPPEIFTLAWVVPLIDDSSGDAPSPEARRRVELAAMEVVMAYERERGSNPRDVSSENLGYDVESGERAIEVKGRAGRGSVTLTANEWITAGRLDDRYYLYIVTDAVTDPKLHIVPDPANRLDAIQELGVVRYQIAPETWQEAAEQTRD
ncbi:MAG: helicase-related protein [Trueperaceae bacterium]|nr:helicase-related protein [Trueperaceae bacterium]